MSGLKTPAHIRFHTLILLVPTPNTFLYLSYLSLRWNIRLVARLWLYLITTLSNTEGLWASSEAEAAPVPGTGLTAFCLENAELRVFFVLLRSFRLVSKIADFPLTSDVAVWHELASVHVVGIVILWCGCCVCVVVWGRWKWIPSLPLPHLEPNKEPWGPIRHDARWLRHV